MLLNQSLKPSTDVIQLTLTLKMTTAQGRVVQSWVSTRFEFRFESLKSISVLILFVYKLMIGSSKNSRENYPRKCFWTQEKQTRVKFNPGLSANRPSNNWAQVVETSATVNNSRIQDNNQPDNHAPSTYEMTPGFKPFTISHYIVTKFTLLYLPPRSTQFSNAWYTTHFTAPVYLLLY